MTTPRIGDTVHWSNGPEGECHRAIVLAALDHPLHLHLRVAYNDALGHFQTTARLGSTRHAGTWHHIH